MRIWMIISFLVLSLYCVAQDIQIDSLKLLLENANDDKQRVDLNNKLAIYLYNSNRDSARYVGQEALEVSQKIGYKRGTEIASLNQLIFDEANAGFVPDSAKSFQIVDRAKKINHPLALGIGYYQLAWLSMIKLQRAEMEAYFRKAIRLFQQENYQAGLGWSYDILAEFGSPADYPKRLKYLDTAMNIAKKIQNRKLISQVFLDKGRIARENSDYPRAFHNFLQAIPEAEVSKSKIQLFQAYALIGNIYRDLDDYDKALEYYKKTLPFSVEKNIPGEYVLFDMGRMYALKGDTTHALQYLEKSLEKAQTRGLNSLVRYCKASLILYGSGKDYPQIARELRGFIEAFEKDGFYLEAAGFLVDLAKVYVQDKQYDQARATLSQANKIAVEQKAKDLMIDIYETQYELYKKTGEYQKALESFQRYQDMREEILGRQKATELAGLSFQNQIKQQEQENQQLKKIKELNESQLRQRTIIIYITVGGVLLLLVLAFILWRNNQVRKRTNHQLAEQRDQISATLTDLKNTQAQLIQSEKMASLGELTAGIAHEIQNPLNFVNNFSEVNEEMADEAVEEIAKGNYDEVKTILKDIKDNAQKTNLHGKRADAIVKSMLEHSRSGRGENQLTDINALCDEYLRLSYQSARSKDESFSCDLETDFDKNISKINIVPQDIGRVLLNLFNNAFYACAERRRSPTNEVEANYQPLVSVSTKHVPPLPGRGAGPKGPKDSFGDSDGGGEVLIKVTDNGNGIPESIKEKIFQPFFTTKPTGSGTGLGLSLSYDIIKAHGGEINVHSGEGKGSEFVIQLPV